MVYQIVSLALILLFQKQSSRRRISIFIFLSCVLIIAVNTSTVQSFIESFAISGSEGRSTEVRFESLMAYFSGWAKNWVLGIGPMEYDHLHSIYRLLNGHAASITDIGFLGFACKYGMLGCALYGAIWVRFISIVRIAIKKRSRYTCLVLGITASYMLFEININSFTIGIVSFCMPITLAIMEKTRDLILAERMS